MSYISPIAFAVVENHARARKAHRACGVQPSGPDLSRWAARDVDVLVLLETERVKESNARIDAEIREQ
jgi:hypothetical protein